MSRKLVTPFWVGRWMSVGWKLWLWAITVLSKDITPMITRFRRFWTGWTAIFSGSRCLGVCSIVQIWAKDFAKWVRSFWQRKMWILSGAQMKRHPWRTLSKQSSLPLVFDPSTTALTYVLFLPSTLPVLLPVSFSYSPVCITSSTQGRFGSITWNERELWYSQQQFMVSGVPFNLTDSIFLVSGIFRWKLMWATSRGCSTIWIFSQVPQSAGGLSALLRIGLSVWASIPLSFYSSQSYSSQFLFFSILIHASICCCQSLSLPLLLQMCDSVTSALFQETEVWVQVYFIIPYSL